MIYIRAARYACQDEGVVFAQNIRMFDNNGRYRKAFMLDDNHIALQDLVVDTANFDPTRCTTPESFDRGIYWSVKEILEQDETIVLNGCDGEEYKISREMANLVETFV